MFKNTPLKTLGLSLSTLALVACTAPAGPIEDSAVVLQNMLAQPTKIYESEGEFNLSFSDSTNGQSAEVHMNVSEKTDATDSINNLMSEGKISLSADLKMLEIDFESEDFSQNLAETHVEAVAELKIIGRDLYGVLSQLDVEGESQAAKQAQATFPLTVGLYMNKPAYVSLEKIESIAKDILSMEGGKIPDFDALMAYSQDQIYKDLAAANILTVKQDHGLEKISTGNGRLHAYHYEVEMNAEGFMAFLEQFNKQTELFTPEEMKLLLDSPEIPFVEMLGVMNEAVTIEMWVGQQDYHPYKVEMSSDWAKMKAVASKLMELSGEATPLNQELLNTMFEGKEMEWNLVIESHPVKSVKVEKPDEGDLLDLNPLLELWAKSLGQNLPTPGSAMTPEELEMMMKGLEGMEGFEGLEINPELQEETVSGEVELEGGESDPDEVPTEDLGEVALEDADYETLKAFMEIGGMGDLSEEEMREYVKGF